MADRAFDRYVVHCVLDGVAAGAPFRRMGKLRGGAARSGVPVLIWRTLLYTALAVAANIGFALAYAVLLDSKLISFGRGFFKLAVFLPVVTPDVAGYTVWRWLYDQSFGAINAGLTLLGLPLFGGIASPATYCPPS